MKARGAQHAHHDRSHRFTRRYSAVRRAGSGLAASGPSIGIPFFADQPFWAEHAYRAGVGPQPIPRKKMTAVNLAQAIGSAVSDQSIRRRAAHIGELIRSEDSVQRALEIFQRYIT